jgi:ArsR family transcriptional regulator
MRPDLDLLADPTRRLILTLLTAEPELCVCELEAALDALQPVVSRQLALLREAGWLEARREGRRIYYRLDPALPPWAHRLLEAYAEGGVPAADVLGARERLGSFAGRPLRLTRVPS